MSRKERFQAEIAGDGPISEETLAYLEQRALSHFYDYIIDKFELEEKKSSLTKAKLARRIRRGPDQVNRLLASPGNWTIATVARLLVGIAGEEPELHSRGLIGRPPKNMTIMDLIEDSEVEAIEITMNGKKLKREENASTSNSIVIKLPVTVT